MFFRRVSPNLSCSQGQVAVTLQYIAALILICEALIVMTGCGATGLVQSTVRAASQVEVAVSPAAVTLGPSAQQRFTATVAGTSNTAVTWWASAGSISNEGTFAAPETSNETQITIIATSLADPARHATGVVTIKRSPQLAITNSSLIGASVSTPYSENLSANGGTPPYRWTISNGSLAPGLRLQPATGTFAGIPSQEGHYSFTVEVTDDASHSATRGFKLAVSGGGNSNFDGPAELPRTYLATSLADTPAPGSTIPVKAGGDLHAALDKASCGDTITLQAGATFVVGGSQYTFPAKACDDEHWIIVRTSAPDASLPPEGSRMTPCYAGVASLPGRPPFSCPKPQHLLATIVFTGGGSGPIFFANGANHYRLIGLEITRSANGMPVTALIGPIQGSSMTHIVLDRLYIHGTPKDETRRGVNLSGATHVAVQDSYISDFHCHVMGTCTDSQAVAGGTGDFPMGPYKIVNNFLEAAAENILFGGGRATQTPADIEIRWNHLFKPMFWMPGQPGFAGPAFIVKNNFELKNAQRVLVDSNVMENSWGGFSQAGFSVLLTPRNPVVNGQEVCPSCKVTDVTIRNVTISHVGGAFQLANPLTLPHGIARAGQRYSIHDVIADDIDANKYNGHGLFAQISTIAPTLLQNIKIDHVTAFPAHVLFNVGGPRGVQMPGFIFTNSIVTSGQFPIWSTGAFHTADCAYYDVPLKTMNLCFSGYSFTNNAILGAPSMYPPSKWPKGNFFYDSPENIGFADFNNGRGGDYHLLPSSRAKGKASDGLDLGANVDSVYEAVSHAR